MLKILIIGSLAMGIIWLVSLLSETRKENKKLKTKLDNQERQIRHLIKPSKTI